MAEASAAPVSTGSTASPSQASSTQSATPPPQQSANSSSTTKSIDPADSVDFDGLLKKQAYKFKAAGKEYSVDSEDKLRRILERGAPFEASLEELKKQREELSPLAQLKEKLASPNEEDAESALEEMLGERLDALAIRRIQKQMEREKSYEGLSPRETQLMQALERERQERQTYESRVKQAEQAKQAEAAKAEQAKILKSLAETAETALKKAGFKGGALEARALAVMQPLMAAMIHAGQEINPDLLSEKVTEAFDEQLTWRMASMGPTPAALKLFESMSDEMMASLPKSFEEKYKALLLKRHREGQPNGSLSVTKAPTPGPQSSSEPAYGTPEWWRYHSR